jgi:hypothetical protein
MSLIKKMIKIFNLHIRIGIRKPKYPHPESEHYMVTVSSPDSDKDLKYPSRFLEDKMPLKKEANNYTMVLLCQLGVLFSGVDHG